MKKIEFHVDGEISVSFTGQIDKEGRDTLLRMLIPPKLPRKMKKWIYGTRKARNRLIKRLRQSLEKIRRREQAPAERERRCWRFSRTEITGCWLHRRYSFLPDPY